MVKFFMNYFFSYKPQVNQPIEEALIKTGKKVKKEPIKINGKGKKTTIKNLKAARNYSITYSIDTDRFADRRDKIQSSCLHASKRSTSAFHRVKKNNKIEIITIKEDLS